MQKRSFWRDGKRFMEFTYKVGRLIIQGKQMAYLQVV